MSLNTELANLFATMAAVMDIRGENPFKAIAFSKNARVLESTTVDLRQAVEDGTLKDIPGIGPSSRKIIEDYVRTGRSTDYEELVASVPAGLLPMLEIPGMGPKTISLIWKERGITSIEELATAIEEGKLAGVKGLGEKKIAAIRQGISMRSQASQRHGLPMAMAMAEALVARVREIPGVKQAEIAGSLRRGRETIGDVDLVCALSDDSTKGEDVTAAFVKFPEVEHINGQGATKASVITAGGLQVDLRIVPLENFGAALLYFTGSKDHNVRLRGLAQDRGMTLNEWGLYRLEEYEKARKQTAKPPEAKPVASKTETDIYRALDLAYIEPELREDRGEIDLAAKGKLPQLVTLDDIRGDLHSHTRASDGTATIEQMIEAAMAAGYEYLGITDHSQSQAIANGLKPDRLMKHIAEIRKIAQRYKGFTVFAGCEVDILADGRLDYEDAILKELDFVIASPHSALKQPEDKATDRLLRAIENPYVNIIGHPTGRLISRREGLPLDFGRIYKVAAETDTVLEINAGYPRLDLNDVRARGARESGVRLSINTDAHSPESFAEIRWGLAVARRAGCEAEDIINCWSASRLKKLFGASRK